MSRRARNPRSSPVAAPTARGRVTEGRALRNGDLARGGEQESHGARLCPLSETVATGVAIPDARHMSTSNRRKEGKPGITPAQVAALDELRAIRAERDEATARDERLKHRLLRGVRQAVAAGLSLRRSAPELGVTHQALSKLLDGERESRGNG
jgi:hypothetical protein